MPLLARILWSEYRRRIYTTVRQLLFLAVVIAVTFFFAAMWPSINFMFTATFQHARYDITVNGPLSAQDVESIKQAFGSHLGSVIGLHAGMTGGIHTESKEYASLGLPNYYYLPSAADKIPWTMFSDGLLLQGSMQEEGAWGIDYMSSRKLDVGIGDTVSFDQTFVDGSGNTHELRQTGTIRAIYAPTNEVHGILSPADSRTAGVYGADGVIYTDLFIELQNISPAEGEMLIRDLPQSKEWLIEAVPFAYERGQARVEQTLNRNVRYATIWAALLVYAIFLFREQLMKVERRKKTVAILFSLGLSERQLIRMFALEQIVSSLITAVLGISLGLSIIQDFLGLYIPRETIVSMSMLIGVIVMLSIAATIAQIVYKLRRLDVARLLATE